MLPSLLAPVRRQVVALAVFAAALLAGGCTPRDPLDREVEGRTIAELQSWIAQIQREVDPELAQEIDLVFVNLAANTPRFQKPRNERDLHARGNPLCQRVNGRPLRAVMIDSYEAANTALTLQNSIDTENLVRLSAVISTDRTEAFNQRADFVKREIARRDEQIRRHRERIEELRGRKTDG
jgi:hypothetical protein